MNIFFLGASGFAGSYAFRLAKSNGHSTWGTGSKTGHPELLKFDLTKDRLAPILDQLERDSKTPSFGIVCASMRQIDQCKLEKPLARQINVTGTIAALKDFKAAGFQPVFLSTSYVFSGERGYYVEEDVRGPVCEYGRQKAEVEAWMEQNHPDGLILRLDKIVGSNPKEEHLFSEWRRWIDAGRPITCIADQIMSPTQVRDIGKAILIACEKNLRGTYHVANTEYFSRDELARQYCEEMQTPADIIVKPQSAFTLHDPRPLRTYLDSTRFMELTGMRFTSMRETWREMKSLLASKM